MGFGEAVRQEPSLQVTRPSGTAGAEGSQVLPRRTAILGVGCSTYRHHSSYLPNPKRLCVRWGQGLWGGLSGLLQAALGSACCSPQRGLNLRTWGSEGKKALHPILWKSREAGKFYKDGQTDGCNQTHSDMSTC